LEDPLVIRVAVAFVILVLLALLGLSILGRGVFVDPNRAGSPEARAVASRVVTDRGRAVAEAA
jgi:hypothetical protein